MKDQSFKDWLQQQIQVVLATARAPIPFILWCDPQREWKEILRFQGPIIRYDLVAFDEVAGPNFKKENDKLLRQRDDEAAGFWVGTARNDHI